MRRLGYSLLAAAIAAAPHAAFGQENAAPSPDEFVCALAGDCADEAGAEESEPADRPAGSPRVSATRGFSLSRPEAPAQQAAPSRTTRRQTASRPSTRPNRPAQQTGRVDLRLNFASGSATLSAADEVRLQAFAEALKRPQLANVWVRIEGHTDSSGGRSINLALSQQRAQAVADYLVANGIAAERLEVRGYGYDRPVPGRRASAGENRRVEAVRIS